MDKELVLTLGGGVALIASAYYFFRTRGLIMLISLMSVVAMIGAMAPGDQVPDSVVSPAEPAQPTITPPEDPSPLGCADVPPMPRPVGEYACCTTAEEENSRITPAFGMSAHQQSVTNPGYAVKGQNLDSGESRGGQTPVGITEVENALRYYDRQYTTQPTSGNYGTTDVNFFHNQPGVPSLGVVAHEDNYPVHSDAYTVSPASVHHNRLRQQM